MGPCAIGPSATVFKALRDKTFRKPHQVSKMRLSKKTMCYLLVKVWSKCGQDLLFVKVWTQMSLAQVLRFGMWKGQKEKPIWRKGIWLVEKIIFNNLKLISNDENPFKFNNFCFFSPKIVKQRLCMLSCWGLFDSTKSIVRGLKFWEG